MVLMNTGMVLSRGAVARWRHVCKQQPSGVVRMVLWERRGAVGALWRGLGQDRLMTGWLRGRWIGGGGVWCVASGAD